jgi:hypothetical protein
MPRLLRKFLGLLLLITTIGLATCQSLSKAEPGTDIAFVGKGI